MKHQAEQEPTERNTGRLRVADLDGACLELAEREIGLALVVGEKLSVMRFDEPIPYRLGRRACEDVECGAAVDDVPPEGWCA